MTALMESQKRKMGGDKDATSQDGGQYPEMYETGSALKYTPITRDPTLVGYWSFEEGSGNATSTDYSGNNNNGTWYGTSTHYGTGKVGSWAGSFNGSSDYVGVSTESDFDFVGSSFSLAGWVKTNTTSTYQRLFNKYGASYTYTTWITSNSGKLEFRWATPTQNSVLSTFGLSPNAWYHVVFVRNDSANLNSIYINGSFNNSASYSGTVIENDEDFALGRTHEAGGVSYLNGYLDAARVYDRALSAAEIQALYNATR